MTKEEAIYKRTINHQGTMSKKLKSGIIGQAQVIFGGAIGVSLGTVKNADKEVMAVGLAELKHPAAKAGDPINDEETYNGTGNAGVPELRRAEQLPQHPRRTGGGTERAHRARGSTAEDRLRRCRPEPPRA